MTPHSGPFHRGIYIISHPRQNYTSTRITLKNPNHVYIYRYGEYGRTGIYDVQKMMRMIKEDGPEQVEVDALKDMLDALPETNRVKQNP